jgi:uncharacterized protein (TIGR02646 family)
MLKTQRPDLPAALQTELDNRQNAVNAGQAGDSPWDDFREHESRQELKKILETMFHQKCAYCESTHGTRHIEHYWPKSPHPHNANKGTPTRMFVWDNLLLACGTCNGLECKASHMEWYDGDKPKLLNPCQDDPLCYLEVDLTKDPPVRQGFIWPRAGLDKNDSERAAYTIRRLKLNQRDDLRRARARTIMEFLGWVCVLDEFGPDYEAPSGNTVRERLLGMLDPSEPYLAAIRQILFFEPDFADLRQQLQAHIPELKAKLDAWALPPQDCQEAYHGLPIKT